MPYAIRKLLRDAVIGVIGVVLFTVATGGLSLPAEISAVAVPLALVGYRLVRPHSQALIDIDKAGS